MNSQETTHSHEHVHPHDHGHSHGHAHSHWHSHGGGDESDLWSGQDYLAKPGVLEVAQITHQSILHSLASAGIDVEDLKRWDVLEIGSGPGAVTKHLLPTFALVHAIDLSPSMIMSLNSYLPSSSYPSLTGTLHALSSSSAKIFEDGEPLSSPTSEDKSRKISPPKAQFDLAVSNLVLHHVDDVDPFMLGAIGLLKKGGWFVLTEFGLVENGKDKEEERDVTRMNKEGKALKGGSVNAPDHYRPAASVESLTELFKSYGLVDVYAEKRGTLPVFGENGPQPPCLIVRGRKA
ncbi:uncharacterized protein IL334_007864 [Kwoniella shivajii]|uniref:Methyltransferase type 11 domain-containing protein n=1 Tax=Kwoniella shivajii TaxID=564305 RepID=A0ABZ1DBZ1_9TREE|nr:hypothetical protein IL334_007864 [Kwoniella shivajii]